MAHFDAIILAAGKGTRMNSDLPKVAHEAAGRAMVEWVIDAALDAGCQRIILVVGHGREIVQEIADKHPASNQILTAVQDEQLGTGHAVACTKHLFTPPEGHVFVLCGDGPLIRQHTLRRLADRHIEAEAAATLATAVLDDPTGYGRIKRNDDDRFAHIVEQKNATEQERAIREINPSYYCFRSEDLFGVLDALPRDEVSGEYYLTDIPAMLLNRGKTVELVPEVPAEDVLSVNTPEQLKTVEQVLLSRTEVQA